MFGDKLDKIGNGANLLVTVASCAVDPTGLALTGAAVSGTLSLNTIFRSSTKDAKALIAAITVQLEKDLTGLHISEDRRRLLPQMLEAALPAPHDIAHCALDPDAIVALMASRLTHIEHRDPATLAAFTKWLRPSLAMLLADTTFISAIAPQIARETLSRLQDVADGLLSLSKTYSSLAASLDDLRNLRASELRALVARFGLNPPRDAKPEALIALLEEQIEPVRAMRAQIANIDHRIPALHNLKAAAQDAANKLDFAEVESLIAQVDQIETETAAETKELRAANLLLMGRADDAYRHYKAAAESYGGIDEQAVFLRRETYAQTLADHGKRFGGTGFQRAIDLWEATLANIDRGDDPLLWARTQHNLAVAFVGQAARVDGPAGAGLLAKAITAYRAVLEVNTLDDHPIAWAKTQNSIGIALRNQATRVAGVTATELLAQAVKAYEDALQVYTLQQNPIDWASTQNNLAIALSEQAKRIEGRNGADLRARAVNANMASLEVYIQEDFPIEWARSMNNLALNLVDWASQVKKAEAAELLAEAIWAYESALLVRTRQELPVDWATTQNNLGFAYRQQAALVKDKESVDLLASSIAAFSSALQFRCPQDHPLDWATSQMGLAVTLTDQANLLEGVFGADVLRQAIKEHNAVLQVYTEEDHPLQWAMTNNNLAVTIFRLANHPSTLDALLNLRAALHNVDAALTVFDPVHTARYHAKASALRDNILSAIAAAENP